MACKCKVNNAWTAVIKFFKKTNGQWEEITESYFEEYEILHPMTYGGHIEPAGPQEIDGEYNPSGTHEPNSNVIYTQTAGKPNVKTDENGKVTEYTFTETGVTTSDVDTGIIAFDSTNPGFHIHLVAEFVPSASTETNAIIKANNGGSSQGLTLYSSGNYCYCKIKTQAYDTDGSKFRAWSAFSPTGRDTNYHKTRNVVTFDIIFTSDKKFTLTINGKETDYVEYDYAPDFDNISIKVGTGIPNFTINELTVTKNNE
jgi:hypothetical protein